jgi:hypothetical protein
VKHFKNKWTSTKAKPKLPGKRVETADEKFDFLAKLTHTALVRVQQLLPQEVRDQYHGHVRTSKAAGDKTEVTATLTHKRGSVCTATCTYSEDDRRAAAQGAGIVLAHALVKDVEAHQRRMKDAMPEPVEVKAKDPDVIEVQAVAKLLDRTRCAACHYTDEQYPDWDDECSHTEQERQGGID